MKKNLKTHTKILFIIIGLIASLLVSFLCYAVALMKKNNTNSVVAYNFSSGSLSASDNAYKNNTIFYIS